MAKNPFRPTRYEHHRSPLIWLSPLAKQLQEPRSFHVSGTRGSGKTSLLKALDWRERANNLSLQDQLNDEEKGLIAVYFRIPDHISFAFDQVDWEESFPNAPTQEALGFLAFSFLIESVAAFQLLTAFDNLRQRGELKATAADCLELCTLTRAKFPRLNKTGFDELGPIQEMANDFDQAQRKFNSQITKGHIEEAMAAVPDYEPGEIILHISEQITRISNPNHDDDIHLKICIDDCEVLRYRQQIYLNTLVRKTKNSLSWIISYVGHKYEATSGLYPEHNLTDADRKVEDLDDFTPSQFIEMCESVSSLRIYYALSHDQRLQYAENRTKLFSLSKVFGNYPINQLIGSILGPSLNPLSVEIENNARHLRNNIKRRKKQSIEQEFKKTGWDESFPPYYQAYILKNINHEKYSIDYAAKIDSVRDMNVFSSYLRRKQRAAFIAICADLGISNIPYAGKSVIIGMSDTCIRDYLELIAEIFYQSGYMNRPLKDFFERSEKQYIGIDQQRVGIQSSSSMKFSAIIENSETHAVELSKLVECFGELLSQLHRDIKTAERGVFSLDLTEFGPMENMSAEDVRDVVARVLSRGESDGLIRTERSSGSDDGERRSELEPWSFYLHRRFAAQFGFSYRGPYQPLKLPWRNVAQICLQPEQVVSQNWAKSVVKALQSRDPDQETLSL